MIVKAKGKPKPIPDEKPNRARTRLIEVAARHFAEHGIQGASQRAIQREVGVNPATAHYYFGSKEALYRAVIETALVKIQAERLAGLESIPDKLKPKEHLRALLSGYLAPHIRVTETEVGYNYARILTAVNFATPHIAAAIIEQVVAPLRERYVDALSKIFPAVSRNRIYEVLRLSVILMAVTPVRLGEEGRLKRPAIEKIISDTVSFAAAGFEALCLESASG
jgi:AcrR family transcriptional regulator